MSERSRSIFSRTRSGVGVKNFRFRTPLIDSTVATVHENFTSQHQIETLKFPRMQHVKFIAWNKWKIWKPKQYEITATILPHNIAAAVTWLIVFVNTSQQQISNLVNFTTRSKFETQKHYSTISYHIISTITPRNKLSLNISKTKYMLITNKHVSTESFVINVNRNRIERTLTYKYLGVIVDQKLTCVTSLVYLYFRTVPREHWLIKNRNMF